MKKKLVMIMGVVLSLAFVLVACAPAVATDATVEKDMTEEVASETQMEAEESGIMLYDFDGNAVDIFADGKRVYLKAWASWCPSCLAGLGELDTLFTEAHDYKVVTIVSPNEYGEQSEENFKEWLAGLEEHPNVEVLFDRDAEMMNSLNIRAFPTSIYFDSQGNQADMHIGHNANADIDSTMAGIQ